MALGKSFESLRSHRFIGKDKEAKITVGFTVIRCGNMRLHRAMIALSSKCGAVLRGNAYKRCALRRPMTQQCASMPKSTQLHHI